MNREFPVSDGIKSTANVQRGSYSISDNFFIFWYRFVFPNISELEASDIDGVYKYAVKPYIDSYAYKAFENVCIQFLRKKNMKNLLPIRLNKIGPWWEKDCEIDILAYGGNGETIVG